MKVEEDMYPLEKIIIKLKVDKYGKKRIAYEGFPCVLGNATYLIKHIVILDTSIFILKLLLYFLLVNLFISIIILCQILSSKFFIETIE